MSHSNSRTWKHPRVLQQEARTKLNQQRGRFCSRSPFFTWNFDTAKHQNECDQLKRNDATRRANNIGDAANLHIGEVRAEIDFRAGRGDHRPNPARVSSTDDTTMVEVLTVDRRYQSLSRVENSPTPAAPCSRTTPSGRPSRPKQRSHRRRGLCSKR